MTTDELLIVIDVQNGFVNANSAHVVQPIAAFLTRWLRANPERLAVLTRYQNPPGSKWESLMDWTNLRTSPETDLVDDLQRLATDPTVGKQILIVDKETYTSLTAQVNDLIRQRSVRKLYLCGIATDACVLKTAMDAFEDNDLVPIVLTDLCASNAGSDVHTAALLLIGRAIGHKQLLTSNEID